MGLCVIMYLPFAGMLAVGGTASKGGAAQEADPPSAAAGSATAAAGSAAAAVAGPVAGPSQGSGPSAPQPAAWSEIFSTSRPVPSTDAQGAWTTLGQALATILPKLFAVAGPQAGAAGTASAPGQGQRQAQGDMSGQDGAGNGSAGATSSGVQQGQAHVEHLGHSSVLSSTLLESSSAAQVCRRGDKSYSW